jgi:hypothetical protein
MDEKGKIDSPICLNWEPTFSYLDEEKESHEVHLVANYDSNNNKSYFLNLTDVLNYWNEIFSKTGKPVK